jgi:hypothetical protein
MTIEELAAVGLPTELEVQNPTASGSGTHEDGEIRSEEEEIGDVNAGVKDLIVAKQSGPLPPSFVFGESKVTTNMIREYETIGFFPRAPDALL